MHRAVLLGVLVICGSAVSAEHQRKVLKYVFDPQVTAGRLILKVGLEFDSGPVDTAELEVPKAWGDATDLRSVTNVRNSYAGGRVRVTWDLVKDWVVPPPRADHHAIIEPTYFEFNTQNGLIHPRLDKLTPVEVRLDWSRLPAGWTLATSFGTAKRLQTFRGTWGEMNNALFAGGDFRLIGRSIAGRHLVVAIRGKWRFADEEAADHVRKVISIERAFWHDYNFPYYLVTVSTFGRDGGGSGGGGFTNAFALFIQRTSLFGEDVQSLLAHETFHTWNPLRMGLTPDSDAGMAWFTEGFTRYYQDVLLLRAGMLSFDEYLQRTNNYLRDYFLSPARNLSNAELIDRRRHVGVDDDLVYTRGAATALWLDSTIRKSTRGESSLDNVMFDLVQQAHGRSPALTDERIYRAASKYLSVQSLAHLREYVELGKTVSVPPDGLGSCANLQMDDIPRFELGMNREDLVGQQMVSGVKVGSAAYAAGARDGQHVSRTDIYWNDVSKPVRLIVNADGASKALEYYPRGESIGAVPQYHLRSGELADSARCLSENAGSASR